jgi:hypothetical protein
MPNQQKRKITHRSSTAMHRSLCSSRSHGPGDNAAGHLDLKIRERKARMSGYGSPQQYDRTSVAELRRPSSVDAIKMAIDPHGGSASGLGGEQAADPGVGRLPAGA